MENDRIAYLKEQVSLLPLLPGVYQFLNREGTIIYVGKAKSLRKRVSSYFVDSREHSVKVRVMVRQIAEIRHIVVGSETDALLLENSLIKTLQPRYNILLKDDKTYPWIVVRDEPFPRVESTRRVVKDGSSYYGPYASISVQRNVLELVHGLYPLRNCSLDLSPEKIARGKYRPCLQYHIGRCKAPCAGKQSRADYDASIEMVRSTLKGDLRATRAYLESQMKEAASAMQFETAEQYRLRLSLLENYSSKSVIVSASIGDLDVFSLLPDDDVAYCNFVRIVSGSVVNSFTATLVPGVDDDPKQMLTAAIQQITERINGSLAREVVVPFLPETELFPGVDFTIPKRGDKLKLLEFSEKSARVYRLEQLKNLEIKDPEKHTNRILAGLQSELHLAKPPRHIECFDNSNIQGAYPVASCVVFRDGKPSRKEYRHFNVKTVEGPDDFASMREIVRRRYARLLAEGSELPDLVVVDGGKGQLSSAYGIFQELGIADRVPLVGLAKRIEEIYFPNDPMPYYLKRTGEPLKVMMHIRDEAHRFGITFHRNKRSKAFIRTELEEIEGVGRVTAERLLSHFRSVAAIRKADREALAEVVGASRADKIYAYFHSSELRDPEGKQVD